jgi:hypothetical protein
MKLARRLFWVCLLLSMATWAQSDRSEAPQSRKPTKAGVHKMPAHAARRLSVREKQERARMRADQRRQAKLAKKQRKEARKRSRRVQKTTRATTQ